jgi:excisionase family DNA binding protein
MCLMEELMKAALMAPDERRLDALKVLKGEAVIADPGARPARPITGPMLMGVGEAARFIGVSRGTLWRVLQAGQLEKVELFPGSYRLRRSDVEELIERRGRQTADMKTGRGNNEGDRHVG